MVHLKASESCVSSSSLCIVHFTRQESCLSSTSRGESPVYRPRQAMRVNTIHSDSSRDIVGNVN